MSFIVVGKGVFTKEVLKAKLEEWGVSDVLAVLRQAEAGRAIAGEYRILAIR